MKRIMALRKLQALEPQLRQTGVISLYIFGSYARDEAKIGSDLDVLVDFKPSLKLKLQTYLAPYMLMCQAFKHTPIGYTTRGGLDPIYRAAIEPTLVKVF